MPYYLTQQHVRGMLCLSFTLPAACFVCLILLAKSFLLSAVAHSPLHETHERWMRLAPWMPRQQLAGARAACQLLPARGMYTAALGALRHPSLHHRAPATGRALR